MRVTNPAFSIPARNWLVLALRVARRPLPSWLSTMPMAVMAPATSGGARALEKR
ncbi:hypothetical protein D3C72_2461530 [compost metagenome]